jgi:DNA-binding response OmpR family regulator
VQPFAPAHQAFQHALNEIRNNSNNPRIHDATYQLETLSAALWPAEDDRVESRKRWKSYNLTTLESRLMDLFTSRLGKIVTFKTFLDYSYFDRHADEFPQEKLFCVKVCHLRKKLKTSPYRITGEWGVGYRMELKPT